MENAVIPSVAPSTVPNGAKPGPRAQVDFAINWKTQHAFSRSQWNQIVRAGLQAACDYWIDNYLPLRFQAYARTMGIYQGKKRTGLPLVSTGNLRASVLQTTRVSRLTATASRQEAIIHIPMPNVPGAVPTKGLKYFNYASNPVVQQALSVVTPTELARMSEVCALVMTEMIESASITMTRAKTVKSFIPNGGTEANAHGYQSQVHQERVGGGQIRARLADRHRMTPKQLKQRAMSGQRRPRLTLRDLRTHS